LCLLIYMFGFCCIVLFQRPIVVLLLLSCHNDASTTDTCVKFVIVNGATDSTAQSPYLSTLVHPTCRWIHWATRWRHSALFVASSSASSHVVPISFRACPTVSIQFFLACPGCTMIEKYFWILSVVIVLKFLDWFRNMQQSQTHMIVCTMGQQERKSWIYVAHKVR